MEWCIVKVLTSGEHNLSLPRLNKDLGFLTVSLNNSAQPTLYIGELILLYHPSLDFMFILLCFYSPHPLSMNWILCGYCCRLAHLYNISLLLTFCSLKLEMLLYLRVGWGVPLPKAQKF